MHARRRSRSSTLPWLMASCTALGVTLAHVPARAEGADSSVAEALFQEARRLSAEQRYAEACPKFAESQRLEPAIGTLLNLATCHASEGKTASAWSEFTRALGEARRDNRADVVDLAQARLAELAPQLSKLVIDVAPESEIPGLVVRLDGQVLRKPAWGVAAPIDPGKHSVRASAPGYADWTTELELGPSEARSQAVPKLVEQATTSEPVTVLTPTASASEPTAANSATQEAHPWPKQKLWAIGVAGAGVVGVATSVVLGFSAKSTFDSAAPHCDAGGCDDTGLGLKHDAVLRGRVATIVFGVGAVAVAAGGVLWLTAPKSTESTAVQLGLTPRALVARWAWR